MLDSESQIRTPHDATVTRKDGKKRVHVHDSRTSVTIKDRGCQLVIFFDDPGRQGPVREIRILPDAKELEPHVLRQFIPQAPLYVRYARATMTNDTDGWVSYAAALREIGATKRGLGDDFYRLVGVGYAALMDEGERYPVKALAAMHSASISAASRWISEARRRGYIAE